MAGQPGALTQMPKQLSSIRGDVFGGITAAIVALPLALAFGVASGLGAIAGIYSAIAVGFFAAAFGGTPAQISGPTGPMTVVMAAVVAQYADRLETALAIVFLGGAIQMLFGLLRIGRFIAYTPYSVISGFMSGIGLIIIIMQALPFLGLPTAAGGPLGAITGFPAALAHADLRAVAIAAASLAVMIGWPARLRTIFPPPLAALLIGTLLSLTLLSGVPVIGEVPSGLPTLTLPWIGPHELASIVQPAFVLALLGSIDSLLTSLVADSISRTHHNSNRELFGQGIGNMAAGLIGALPGAGATMRTVINIRAGGRTRLSGVVHSLILLSLVLGFGPLVAQIPHAALAGILVKVGWDIIDWGYLKHIRTAPRDKVIVMLVTLALTVFVDLITAVAVGLILAGFVTARWMEAGELKGITTLALSDHESLSKLEQQALESLGNDVVLVSLRGRFSYASARELTKRVGTMAAGYKAIILDMSEAADIDTTAAMAIDDLIRSTQSQGIHCVISGLSGAAEATLRSLGVLKALPAENRVATPMAAIERAEALVTG
jgi:sulfate permease, SulP family